MRGMLLILALLGLHAGGVAAAEESAGAAAFAKLKALAGEWEGPFEWTGGRTGGGSRGARPVVLYGAPSVLFSHEQ